MDDLIKLPKNVNEIRIRRYQQQEDYHNGIEEKMKWECEINDSCILDGTYNKMSMETGDTQEEAYNNAIKRFFDE